MVHLSQFSYAGIPSVILSHFGISPKSKTLYPPSQKKPTKVAVKYLLDFPDWEAPVKWTPGQNIFFMGSCFAENISQRLKNLGLNILSNPFGVVYNPVSIATQISLVTQESKITEDDFYFDGEVYNFWDSSHKFSKKSAENLLTHIENQRAAAAEYIASSKLVVLSLGTAWVYRLLASENKVVSNCHKAPKEIFSKSLLSQAEINTSLESIEKDLKTLNPDIEIIYTLSPVRYLRDGLSENFLAKAKLRIGIDTIVKTPQYYLPAYEILIDCLRDYRFFASDMLHPSEQSIDIIYRYFIDHILDQKSKDQLALLEKYQRLKNHKIFQKDSQNEHIQKELDKLASQLDIEGLGLLQ